MIDLVEELSPLEAPLPSSALQCPDILSSNPSPAEYTRVLNRFAALCSNVEQQEKVQFILEKLVKGSLSASPTSSEQDVTKLESQIAQLKSNLEKRQSEINHSSKDVVEKIERYEEKRSRLQALLSSLSEAENQQQVYGEETMDQLERQAEEAEQSILSSNERQATLEDQCRDLEAMLEELDSKRRDLQASLSSSSDPKPLELEQSMEALESHSGEIQERLDWVCEVQAVLSGLSGLSIQDFVDDSFSVHVAPENLVMQLSFSAVNATLASVQLRQGILSSAFSSHSPNSSSVGADTFSLPKSEHAAMRSRIQTLIDRGVQRNDVRFVVRELRQLESKVKEFQKEIAQLRTRFPVSLMVKNSHQLQGKDDNVGFRREYEVIVTLPQSVVATVEIGDGYPVEKQERGARLVALEAFNGWKESFMKEIVQEKQSDANTDESISDIIEWLLNRFQNM